LAVAHAECGRFDVAIQIIDQALSVVANTTGDPALLTQLRQEKQIFQSGRRLTEVLQQ
jgi:hypothetical protein